jgi:hypothetical protein
MIQLPLRCTAAFALAAELIAEDARCLKSHTSSLGPVTDF